MRLEVSGKNKVNKQAINEVKLNIKYGNASHTNTLNRLICGDISEPTLPILDTNDTNVFLTFVGYCFDVNTYPELNAADAIALPIDAKIIINIEFHDIVLLSLLFCGITATVKHIKLAEPRKPIKTFFLENLSFK